MSFVPAKCPSCGAGFSADPSARAAICEFCKTELIVEQAIRHYNVTNHITDSVVNLYGQQSPDQLWENAAVYLRFNDFDTARGFYAEMTKNFAADYRGWWGLFVCETRGLTEMFYGKHIHCQRALLLAPEHERERLQREYAAYRDRFLAKSRGEYAQRLAYANEASEQSLAERKRLETDLAVAAAALQAVKRKRRLTLAISLGVLAILLIVLGAPPSVFFALFLFVGLLLFLIVFARYTPAMKRTTAAEASSKKALQEAQVRHSTLSLQLTEETARIKYELDQREDAFAQ
ncbi:MAG: hypothetical protein ABFC62_02525 [Clostridiaceae bacterium]|nr:hypothetical protein [Eubacteriales bacterium]